MFIRSCLRMWTLNLGIVLSGPALRIQKVKGSQVSADDAVPANTLGAWTLFGRGENLRSPKRWALRHNPGRTR